MKKDDENSGLERFFKGDEEEVEDLWEETAVMAEEDLAAAEEVEDKVGDGVPIKYRSRKWNL